MTLILTRVARDGIVMAADSAITEEFSGHVRILHGATKLIPHAASSSCVGTWGAGTIPNPDPQKAPIAIEFVIRSFIRQAVGIDSGLDFVEKLRGWLTENYAANQFTGLDIATVRPRVGLERPAVFRLTNAATPDKPPQRFFTSHVLRPPEAYDDSMDQIIISAGDTNAALWVEEFHTASRHAVERSRRGALPKDILGLSGWLPSVVRAVSDAYHSLEIGQSIGGRIDSAALHILDGRIVIRTD